MLYKKLADLTYQASLGSQNAAQVLNNKDFLGNVQDKTLHEIEVKEARLFVEDYVNDIYYAPNGIAR